MHSEIIQLNQTIVLSAMEAIEHWERWTNIVPKGATKALNLQLIRLTKGLVKAYRMFLLDKTNEKQQNK